MRKNKLIKTTGATNDSTEKLKKEKGWWAALTRTYLEKADKKLKKRLTPDLPDYFDDCEDEMNLRDTWAKGTNSDTQIVASICKKLASDQYEGWANHDCPMRSRHKTQLMIGLCMLIPNYLSRHKIDTELFTRQLFSHLLAVNLQSYEKAQQVTWKILKKIDEEMQKHGRKQFDPWDEHDPEKI